MTLLTLCRVCLNICTFMYIDINNINISEHTMYIYVVTLFVIIIHGCNQYDFEPTRLIISFLNRSRSRGCKHSVSYDIWEFGQCPKQGHRTPTHGVTVSGVSCKQRVLDCRRHFGQIGVEWTIGAHLSNCPCNQNNYVPLYKFC